MIVKWFISVATSAVTFLLGLLPSWSPPSWMSSVTSTMTTFAGYIGQMGNVLPLSAMSDVVVLVLAVFGIAAAVRIGRIVLSFLTAGGGSAA